MQDTAKFSPHSIKTNDGPALHARRLLDNCSVSAGCDENDNSLAPTHADSYNRATFLPAKCFGPKEICRLSQAKLTPDTRVHSDGLAYFGALAIAAAHTPILPYQLYSWLMLISNQEKQYNQQKDSVARF